jgi:hypothetical protein
LGRSPTYSLATIQAGFSRVADLTMTASARQGAVEIGFSDQDVVDAIQALTDDDFFKTMPPVSASFTAMHDVYKSSFLDIELYIKFQVLPNGQLLLSFKEK